jgi:hypothetical protein
MKDGLDPLFRGSYCAKHCRKDMHTTLVSAHTITQVTTTAHTYLNTSF